MGGKHAWGTKKPRVCKQRADPGEVKPPPFQRTDVNNVAYTLIPVKLLSCRRPTGCTDTFAPRGKPDRTAKPRPASCRAGLFVVSGDSRGSASVARGDVGHDLLGVVLVPLRHVLLR